MYPSVTNFFLSMRILISCHLFLWIPFSPFMKFLFQGNICYIWISTNKRFHQIGSILISHLHFVNLIYISVFCFRISDQKYLVEYLWSCKNAFETLKRIKFQYTQNVYIHKLLFSMEWCDGTRKKQWWLMMMRVNMFFSGLNWNWNT